MELQPILHVWIHPDNDLVDLTITSTTPAKGGHPAQHTSEVVHTNQKHPFLTIEKGFLPVGQIKVGMHVIKADGSIGVITEWKSVPGSQVMYNLEVAQDHTFAVGEGMWVVHNHCGTGGSGEGFQNQKLLDSHFAKHGGEFGSSFANANEYEQGALDFMTKPSSSSADLHEGLSLRPDATIDTIRVDTSNGEYGVMGEDGRIRSSYIPDPAKNGGSSPEDWFLDHIEDLLY